VSDESRRSTAGIGDETATLAFVATLRRLVDTARRLDAPADVLARAAVLVAEAEAVLSPHRHDGLALQGALRGPNPDFDRENADDPGTYFPYSPIVGPLNPISPPVPLHLDGDHMRGRTRIGAPWAGPPGLVHGGVVALLFDELLGSVNVSKGLGAMTGTLSVRYERGTPLDTDLELDAWIDRVEGRKIITHGTITAGGLVTARAEGIFIRARPS
jgi:acyl-coenzyme A thioesterase PaaI-like protein